MKTFYLKIFAALFLLCFTTDAWSQKDSKKYDATLKSFNDFFNNFDWTDYEEAEPKESFGCRADGIPRLHRMRNPWRNADLKKMGSTFIPILNFMSAVESTVAGDNFDNVKEAEGSIFDTPNFKRDKMIEKIQTANSAEQFIDFYGTKLDQSKVNFSKDERAKLRSIYIRANRILSWDGDQTSDIEEYKIGDCNYKVTSEMWPTKIESNKLTWEIRTSVRLDCSCAPESSIYKLKSLAVIFRGEFTSTWNNYNYESIRWSKKESLIMKILRWQCCEGSKSDPWFWDDDGDPKPEESEDNDSEEEEDKLKEKDKDCCYEEQASNTIGVFPILSFGNNLDDSTIGVSIEYLHNMGNSFGNNEWFAGLEGTFATSSAQDGEIKENYYSGTAIVENRTPVLPCVQWVQRVAAEYGKGTFEAFGNEEDFTNFTVGVNTGFNFDLSSNVSVAVDANIFEIGGQTFTPMTGPEIETDITNLNLPPTKVRFGFRFRF